jgi:glutamate racemase
MKCPKLKSLFITALLLTILCSSCNSPSDIKDAILNHRNSFYYVDFKKYPSNDPSLPVGVFDSGTGGLSVLADIVQHEGLAHESYIYMGDMANMPYGSYSLENNTELLIEHVIKDIQFLLGNKFYNSGESVSPENGKKQVKAIVIACNTATAYALDTVRRFLSEAGSDIGVIGVIDAGARGAFGNFTPGENGSIAVMATDGTVKSGAYPKAILLVNKEDGQEEEITVFQQAGIGIAEAIDGSPDAIDRNADSPRADYKGPSEGGSGDMKIERELLKRYDFDLGNGAMLFDGDTADPRNIQINSVENYIAFHVVSLMEKIRKCKGVQPLNSVVLACTHYPFFTETIRSEFNRLRDYMENGEYIYRHLIAEDLILVNPATEVADQLFGHLASKELLNDGTGEGSEFYISVPSLTNKTAQLRKDGSFTYDYKYGRRAGEIQEYVKIVPFSRRSIPEDVLKRLAIQIPDVWSLITEFSTTSPKCSYLSPAEKITGE